MKTTLLRTLFTPLFIILICFYSTSQDVVESREAPLVNGGYEITGTATLELLDTDELILKLSSDYATDSGPDVQLHLTNHPTNIDGGFFVENLADSRKFSGSQEWNLGIQVEIDEFKYIIFRCVQFGLHWAGGEFKNEDDGGGGNGGGGGESMDTTCMNTIAATEAWATEVDICATDGEDDIIPLRNTLMIPAGDSYAYVITNVLGEILRVHFEDELNFEGTGFAPIRVYGISYSGELTYNQGDPWTSIQAENCIIFSDDQTFLTVTKNGCGVEPECFETNVASTNWVTDISICPSDGESDIIQLQNNIMIPAGDSYAYVITDENQIIKKVHLEDSYNFEGSGDQTDFVYGVSYEGTLSFDVDNPLSSITATGCATISSSELFIKVTKNSCQAAVGSISGKVSNFNDKGVSGVTITLNTGATAVTNADGVYTFNDLPLDNPYTLTPEKNDNFSNGVSAQDLVIMSRHILGLQPLSNPFQLIAADANKDENISALDIINYINIIIGKSNELSNNTSWRFVPGSKTFGSNDDPFDFVEKDAIQNLTGDVTDLDFTAVKTGDISGNASVN